MAGADAPPNCRADTSEGSTLYDTNSDGNDDDDSFSDLQRARSSQRREAKGDTTYLSSEAFSASLPRLKLSKPPHTFTRRLFAKKPELSPVTSAIPSSRKFLGVRRALGFGLSSRLKQPNNDWGMPPREAAVGRGCGGCAVAGGGCVGLKVEWMRRPSA